MQPIEHVSPSSLAGQAEAWREEIIAFAKQLVTTPSLCGEEGRLAALLTEKMRGLGYDEVFVDELGNCVGRIRGTGTGPTVLYTAHLDHQAPGEREDWQFGPYDGAIADGYLHGRGASNHKGALAAMVYAGALLKHLRVPLRGDFLFAGVVQAHAKGNVGMRYLVDKTLPEHGIHYDLVVLGAPTNLDVHLGHRGRLELEVITIGRTSHAGAPWLGVNAVYKMQGVIAGVQELGTSLPSHPFLDKSTLSLTGIESAPADAGTIPDRCTIALDRRFLPSESPDAVVWQVQSIVNRLSAQDPELKAEVRVRQAAVTSYTGATQTAARLMHPFVTEADHALVTDAKAGLEAIGQTPRFGKWNFTTDGGYTASVRRVATIGYAPGDEKYAQTPFDRLRIDNLVQATGGYAAISLRISG